MRRDLLTTTAMAAVAVLSLSCAQAAPVTFFGEDGNPTGGTPMAHPVSDATQASFFSNLSGIGVDGIDSVPSGTSNVPVNFGNGVTATLTGGIVQNLSSAGRFAISSPNYYNASSATFGISFSSPIAAFGFYGTDIGDFGGQLTLTLTDSHGVMSMLVVPNSIGAGGGQPENGSVLYYGFYDTSNTYTSVSFGNSSGGADVFGFDDFSVGTLEQVHPAPEPGTLALIGMGLLTLTGLRRRRKS